MSGLQRFERRLESAISGVFARTFRSAVQPVEIAAALERELANNAQVLSRDKRLVPNAFHVELSASDIARLSPYDSTLQRELTDQITQHASSQSYVFPGPVAIDFESADDLTTGRFRVRSQAQAKVTSQLDDQPGRQVTGRATGDRADGAPARRARAVLDVNGVTQPLHPPGLLVGRGTEADLRVDDPGVSRRHAEFVVRPAPAGRDDLPPAIEIRDLGSTNGITVDGRKVPHATLRDGSSITIGKTTMVVRIVESVGRPDGV